MSAIMLDALGTLVELQPPAPRLRAELAVRFGVQISEQDAERAMAAEITFYRSHLDEGKDEASVAALRARCAQTLVAELREVTALEHVGQAEMTAALLASIQFRPFADVPATLRAARVRGLRLVVVSNWDASLHEVLARLALTPLLDGVVTSAQAGARKPAPQIFARALGLVGAAAEHTTHVGDSLEEDVAGARAAGITPVLLRRDGTSGPAGVRTIRSLAELGS